MFPKPLACAVVNREGEAEGKELVVLISTKSINGHVLKTSYPCYYYNPIIPSPYPQNGKPAQ